MSRRRAAKPLHRRSGFQLSSSLLVAQRSISLSGGNMAASSVALVKWLTRLLSDITEDGGITRFELIHKIEGEHAERLELWHNGDDTSHDPQELAQEMHDCAERDVQSR